MDPFLTRDANSERDQHTLPGMAHFAGTGPKRAVCGGCAYWVPPPNRAGERCAKYTELMGGKWHYRVIPFHTPACKYWAKKNAKK